VAYSVLLGMEDVAAQSYRILLEENTDKLKILPSNVPIFHNLMDALLRETPKPDIFYLQMCSIKFDSQNIKDIEREILTAFFAIRKDPRLRQLRIAVQTSPNVSTEFINKLTLFNIWDIFVTDGKIDLSAVARQLSKPADIVNVQHYICESLSETQPTHSLPDSKIKHTNTSLKGNIGHSVSTVVPPHPQKSDLYPGNKRVNRSRLKSENKKDRIKFYRISAILILVILVMGCLYIFYFNKNNIHNSTQRIPSFNTLIQSKKYILAAKYYNSRGIEVENKMLADTSVKDKGHIAHKILKYNSSDAIQFDNCYFDQDYDAASNIYESSDDSELIHLSQTRRIMVAYSLMKTGQADKALKIAEPLDNKQFVERIKIYKQFYDANKILKSKINSGELSEQDLEKAREQVKDNEKEMNKI